MVKRCRYGYSAPFWVLYDASQCRVVQLHGEHGQSHRIGIRAMRNGHSHHPHCAWLLQRNIGRARLALRSRKTQ
ncbi:hypothetical protein TP47_10985 [Xanthomonas citri pv. aurantifolii]|nr:hypothetical protein TP37_21345 [Xanthomonas citri pv. aurantifolii]AMV04665.1 hypothetical protein TP50_21140 [Xanthomonas citri pv. aurantifolii]AMV06125.1 hypothetical protein AC028_04170 [Xanthomonas citri pv. aurantifolii]ARE58243.1 hypothetical protein TP45_19195 [Xanthomonas citri pv. aurantifolii]TBW97548.1 hypothetical protein TP47_10985 [Xanthomonas citri pv. aurantifolii]